MLLARKGLSLRGRRLSRYAAAMAAMAAILMAGCTQMSVLAWNQVPMTEFHVDGTRLYMQGAINSKTLKQFEDVYAKHPNIKTLVELDVPGSLDDDTMIALAYRVRELGLNTHLEASSLIQSGGVDLFLAGVRRTMAPGAQIGVHSWSDGSRDAKDYPRDAPEHEQNRLYIERMLGDDSFYWFTIYAAPADDIHFMSSTEIKKYGLLSR
ncbi:alpha/beta hydrolase [Ruegeria sp. EL01]|jgi:beta-lactamase class D|uniref:COG3904 family protein n=1 Tax=Ruegeria sp. EL01 TaxID=2107578 RepID=UPI000EA7F606|nr:alpha/beta hydrolase [Ruegeria sp. EL01]